MTLAADKVVLNFVVDKIVKDELQRIANIEYRSLSSVSKRVLYAGLKALNIGKQLKLPME